MEEELEEGGVKFSAPERTSEALRGAVGRQDICGGGSSNKWGAKMERERERERERDGE